MESDLSELSQKDKELLLRLANRLPKQYRTNPNRKALLEQLGYDDKPIKIKSVYGAGYKFTLMYFDGWYIKQECGACTGSIFPNWLHTMQNMIQRADEYLEESVRGISQ